MSESRFTIVQCQFCKTVEAVLPQACVGHRCAECGNVTRNVGTRPSPRVSGHPKEVTLEHNGVVQYRFRKASDGWIPVFEDLEEEKGQLQ